MRKIRLFGFTLNEVMIVLAVLGIVAMLTVPTLQANIQSRKWSATSQDFVRELEESLKIMNLKKVLAGHETTKDFVSKLSEYIKIVNVCENDDLQSCFTDTVLWGGGDVETKEVNMKRVKLAKHFGLEDWGTELIGVEFANGVTGLVAYNPECVQMPLSNEPPLLDCIALLYDTSAFSYPNASGKDIRSYGMISSLGGATCVLDIDGICFTTTLFKPTALRSWECAPLKDSLGMKYACGETQDYWVGAVQHCGGIANMPTMQQLATLANYLYGRNDITAYSSKKTGLSWRTNVVRDVLNFTEANKTYFYVWSGEEVDAYDAKMWEFRDIYTLSNTTTRMNSIPFGLCVD